MNTNLAQIAEMSQSTPFGAQLMEDVAPAMVGGGKPIGRSNWTGNEDNADFAA